MIKSFVDKRTQDLYLTGKAKRVGPDISRRAARKLEYIDLATKLDDLKVPIGNQLKALAGDRKGQYSIGSMINGVSASDSLSVTPTTSSSATITEQQ